MPSRSRGISPSMAVRSSASHSVVCGRHGPVRYGWSSSSGRVDRNLPTISISIVKRLFPSLRSADNETHCGGGAAAEVEGAEGFGALDLILAGRAADLLGRVEQHSHTGSSDRVSAADQSSAGIDRQPAADLDLAVFDGLP